MNDQNLPGNPSPEIGPNETPADTALLNLLSVLEMGAEADALAYRRMKTQERALFKQAQARRASAAAAKVTAPEDVTVAATLKSAWRLVAAVVQDLATVPNAGLIGMRSATRGASDRVQLGLSASATDDSPIQSVQWKEYQDYGLLTIEWNQQSAQLHAVQSWTLQARVVDLREQTHDLPARWARSHSDGSVDTHRVYVEVPGTASELLKSSSHVSVRCLASPGDDWHVEISFLPEMHPTDS